MMNYATIQKIVKASGITAGELILVHFWGEDADKEIANRFMAAVAALGASPILLQQSRSINRDLFSAATEKSFDERYFALFAQFDAVLDVFAYRPVVLGYDIGETQFGYYRKYMAQLFHKLMGAKRFTQIRIPTAANAQETNLPPEDYIRRMEAAYDIDYEALKSACKTELLRFEGANKVAIRSGTDCVLHLDLTGRPWHMDAGDGDLPCGEIYVAPIEAATNGTVFFPQIFLEQKEYADVTMTVRDGKLCACSVQEIMDYFAALPEENRVVCELGIGMNPKVTELCGETLLDEKMAGTFHIALGANNMFGGSNAASDHIDFVGFGTVEVMK